jgi:integrase
VAERKTLTVKKVESRKLKAEPAGARKRERKDPRDDHRDAIVPGLALRVTGTGHKSYVLIARYPGSQNPTRRVLGRPGRITLDQAREKAREWLALIDKGTDPAAAAKKRRTEATQRVTFAFLREEHIARHWRAGKLRKADEAERLLKKEFAAWDDRPAADITGDDVDEVITAIVDRGAVGQARNVLAYLRGLYSWALANRRYRIRESPCEGFSPTKLFGEKPTRNRWLRDDELRAVWNASSVLGRAEPVVKLLILTACRLNEIGGLRREEIGEDAIIIPGARMYGSGMKGKVDHLIPLTPEIRKIIDAVPQYSGPCIFSTTDGRVPMTIGSKLKDKLDAALPGMPHWIWHDLRRTARTNWSKLSISEEVREALLAHVKKGVKKNYNLHDYAQEKRDALMKWETALARIVTPPPPTVEDFAEHMRQRPERRVQL